MEGGGATRSAPEVLAYLMSVRGVMYAADGSSDHACGLAYEVPLVCAWRARNPLRRPCVRVCLRRSVREYPREQGMRACS